MPAMTPLAWGGRRMTWTPGLQEQVRTLRTAGVTYSKISEFLNLNANSVKSWCRRNNVEPDINAVRADDPEGVWCRSCGTVLTPGRRAKFCSEACRRSWWHAHSELINRRAFYTFTCAHCGGEFEAYGNSTRRYCTHSCYIQHRFGTRGGRR
ncbi:RNA polymerase subunit sigma-70 [Bifidobacterium subtile]|nr:RNA polymerase subunit sigma-70 [Bifidobacterium subtile]MCI1223797.1 RNA polymerase subunit sigma-70 [Bifidobacterium subtile]MCI1241842.1 RNA polymerase subunit sigma-70 [Bifidobacterium subtile]MCI1258653.1 RNA polymerase subunit sigma-70 [Bifidobacterium subtile]